MGTSLSTLLGLTSYRFAYNRSMVLDILEMRLCQLMIGLT